MPRLEDQHNQDAIWKTKHLPKLSAWTQPSTCDLDTHEANRYVYRIGAMLLHSDLTVETIQTRILTWHLEEHRQTETLNQRASQSHAWTKTTLNNNDPSISRVVEKGKLIIQALRAFCRPEIIFDARSFESCVVESQAQWRLPRLAFWMRCVLLSICKQLYTRPEYVFAE